MSRHTVIYTSLFYTGNVFPYPCGESTYSASHVLLPTRASDEVDNVSSSYSIHVEVDLNVRVFLHPQILCTHTLHLRQA